VFVYACCMSLCLQHEGRAPYTLTISGQITESRVAEAPADVNRSRCTFLQVQGWAGGSRWSPVLAATFSAYLLRPHVHSLHVGVCGGFFCSIM
jgi:hypothetical protein